MTIGCRYLCEAVFHVPQIYIHPEAKLLAHVVILFLISGGTSTAAALVYISTSSSLFFTSLPSTDLILSTMAVLPGGE